MKCSHRNLTHQGGLHRLAILLLFGLISASSVESGPFTITPVPVDREIVLSEAPYAYLGVVVAEFPSYDGNYSGSGCIIGNDLILTAAHVLYNSSTEEWASEVRFYPRYYQERTDDLESLLVDGYIVWEEYADYPVYQDVEDYDKLIEAKRSQLDIAILYKEDLGSASFPALNISFEGEALSLISDRDKMLLGYPAWTYWLENSYVKEENDLKVHQLGPDNYWFRQEDVDLKTNILGRYFWNFTNDRVPAIPRNSGGPLFIQQDDGSWTITGVVVKGIAFAGDAVSIYRVLGDDVIELIQEAINQVDDRFMLPVDNLSAQSTPEGVQLSWSDSGYNEDGYEIWTQDLRGKETPTYTRWKLLDKVGKDVTDYTDTSAPSGSSCLYKIRPYQATTGYTDQNFGPFSRVTATNRSGQSESIASASGEPLLHWITGGNTNAQAIEVDGHEDIWFAGVDHNGEAWVETKVMGPGTFDFSFTTSCERNYDVFTFDVNDIGKGSWSGETGPLEKSIQLPGGLNVLRWTFSKDDDFKRYDDRAYLHSVSWTPDDPLRYLPGAHAATSADTETAYYAPWLGWYDRTYSPWLYHYSYGWLYCLHQDNGTIYFYHDGDWLYIVPQYFPWVYSLSEFDWMLLE